MDAWQALVDLSPLWMTLAASGAQWTVAALVGGAATVFDSSVFSARLLSAFYALGVGFMLATATSGLLTLALQSSAHYWPGVPAVLLVVPLTALGALALALVSRVLHHQHHPTQLSPSPSQTNNVDTSFALVDSPDDDCYSTPQSTEKRRTAAMVALGIALQQIPEGIVSGVVYGSAGVALPGEMRTRALGVAVSLTLSSLLEAVPEALSMVVPLHGAGVARWRILLALHATMLVQCAVAALSCVLVSLATSVLPLALAVSGGALLYITLAEMAPSAFADASTQRRNSALALASFLAMFTLLAVFD